MRSTINFTANIHGCINHPCSADVIVTQNADGEADVEVLSWSDGFSEYTDTPDRIAVSIAEACE